MPLNIIQQLISSTTKVPDKPYLMLFQHSMHQRHVMASETSDLHVYRRAKVKTPAQNAQRDYLGPIWILYIARECVNTAKGLIWVQTMGTIPVEDVTSLYHVTILKAATNPFGWDDEHDGNETLTLENLQTLATAIQTQVKQHKRPIVIESLTPLVMRHGLSRTMAFLRKLIKSNTAIITPILMETLTPSQHRALEDMAHAVFYLHGGELILIRQGVRERGNTVCERIPFDVQTNEVNGNISIQVLKQEDKDKEEEEKPVSLDTGASDATHEPKQTTTTRPGKVQLKLEDEDSPATKEEVSHPHFYVQDNDPEFEDMDEEDPDDDLDI